jgi:hypothetical protein
VSDNDFLYQRFGGVRFPIKDGDTTDGQLYSSLDPVRDRLVALFRAAINQELGRGVNTVVAGSPWDLARTATNLATALPVADTLFTSPTAEKIKELKIDFPLLCLYRVSSDHEEFSLVREAERCAWGFDYVLPPLSGSELRKLSGVLSAVGKIVQLVVRRRGHPAYESGALQFGTDKGTLSILKVKSSQQGPASFSPTPGETLVYYALHAELESLELDAPYELVVGGDADGTPTTETDFEGVDYNLGVGGADGILPDETQARTDFLPPANPP